MMATITGTFETANGIPQISHIFFSRGTLLSAECRQHLLSEMNDCVRSVQKQLRGRLFSLPGTWSNIRNAEEFEEVSRLYELVKRTVTLGESNSLLIIGPRGAGKTRLLNVAVNDLKRDAEISENLLEVHLNGLLQTDDRIALKEITRQLKLENVVGDKVFGSFAETLQFLLESLCSGDQDSKSVLFVLDEFDLFGQHKNQTLLYNLFDIAQQAQTPICVVGLTARHDVIELLEKRVKSRFSHRQIYLLNNYTCHDHIGIFRDYLTLGKDFQPKSFGKEWNDRIQILCEDVSVVKALKHRFAVNKDIRQLQLIMQVCLCKVTAKHHCLESADVVEACQEFQNDSKSALLHGVSILELCLIIAMKHLDEIYVGEPSNFEMIYKEFEKFARRRSSMQIFDKAVVLKAFEHLHALELVRCSETNSKIQKEYRPTTLMISYSQIEEVLLRYPNCPTDIIQWLKSPVLN